MHITYTKSLITYAFFASAITITLTTICMDPRVIQAPTANTNPYIYSREEIERIQEQQAALQRHAQLSTLTPVQAPILSLTQTPASSPEVTCKTTTYGYAPDATEQQGREKRQKTVHR